jgi:hypothetical protein
MSIPEPFSFYRTIGSTSDTKICRELLENGISGTLPAHHVPRFSSKKVKREIISAEKLQVIPVSSSLSVP